VAKASGFIHVHTYQEACIEHNKQTKLLEVSNLEDYVFFTGPSFERESEDMKRDYVLTGALLMNLFIALTTVSLRHPLASRVSASGTGLILVVFSQLGAFGLYYLSGHDLNAPMMIGMPLLAFGLGVDDMFVLLRYFSGLGYDFIATHSKEDIMGEVFARAGPGTTLTSVCNTLVFSCGSFLPIPAMSDFCLCAACVAVVNYLITMNAFMPALVLEITRIKQGAPELS
jgi:predicted RND superfamily exporter protein